MSGPAPSFATAPAGAPRGGHTPADNSAIDLTRAVEIDRRSANASLSILLIVVMFHLAFLSWMISVLSAAPASSVPPSALVAAGILVFWPASNVLFLALPMLFLTWLVSVKRAVIVYELVVSAAWLFIVACATLLAEATLLAPFGLNQAELYARYGYAPNIIWGALVLLIAVGCAFPQLRAAWRFRRLRWRLRTHGFGLAESPWRRRAFRLEFSALGLGQRLLAFSGILIGLQVLQASWWALLAGKIGWVLLLAILGFGLVQGANMLVRRARRRSMPALRSLLARDQRPPVLFLRAFSDDHIALPSRRRPPFWPLLSVPLGHAGSFEEAIAGALSDVGPVIAIGRPGETAAPLGAAREYLDHDRWQQRVDELLGTAKLVAMVPAVTEGVFWELQRVLGSAHRHKLLILFPPLPEVELRTRWSAIASRQATRELPALAAWMPPPGTMVLSIGEDGAPRAWTSRARRQEDYQLALRLAAHEALVGPLPQAALSALHRC